MIACDATMKAIHYLSLCGFVVVWFGRDGGDENINWTKYDQINNKEWEDTIVSV